MRLREKIFIHDRVAEAMSSLDNTDIEDAYYKLDSLLLALELDDADV